MSPVIFKSPNFGMASTSSTTPTLVSASGRERSPVLSRRASKISISDTKHIRIKTPLDSRKLSLSPALLQRSKSLFSNRTKLIAISILTIAVALTAGILAVKFSHTNKAKVALWQPKSGSSWQLDLSTPLTDTSVNTTVYDIDLFGNDAATIAALHALGRSVICYFSAGTYDAALPDHASFHAADVRDSLPSTLSSSGERWVDTRSASVQAAMLARLDLAVKKGCDGVDPGFTDSYTYSTGFALTRATALQYLQFLHSGAEARGIGIGLRNTEGLVEEAVGMMGWSINGGCEGKWNCALYWPFISAGKSVFHWVDVDVDIGEDVSDNGKKEFFCGGANTEGFSTVLKKSQVGSWVQIC